VHLKYPTQETIRQFFENLNYGVPLKEKMETSLFMGQKAKTRTLFLEDTIPVIAVAIGNKLPTSWARLQNRNQRVQDFNERACIPVISQIPTTILPQYNLWLAETGPKVMIDFRTPMFGEAREDMVHSDDDADLPPDEEDLLYDDIDGLDIDNDEEIEQLN